MADRMQYAAAMILLHRPLAQFGKDLNFNLLAGPSASASAELSRQICVDHASRIARCVQEYSDCHGSVMTMSWVSLHIVATAATTLIANIAERRSGADVAQQLDSLRKCLGTLNELEKSHVVTRRVRKVIQSAIRLLNIDAVIQTVGSNNSTSSSSGGGAADWSTASATALGGPASSSSAPSLLFMPPTPSPSQHNVIQQPFPLFNLLPSSNAPFEFLNSFESYFS